VTDRGATGWFEQLYAAAESGDAEVPWERQAPRELLVEWAAGLRGDGRRAVVVGCGLGTDAELIAGLGFDTVAFDVAPTAVRMARARFPASRVEYAVADLLDLPEEWRGAFDLVVESITVQSLPPDLRDRATAGVRSLVAPGGTLIVVATAREEGHEVDGPPWPLTRTEVEAFAADGLETVRLERIGRRWRAELRRPAG
jgi:SAM-dependent methyltransferase